MTIVVHAEAGRLRKLFSFTVSLILHGLIAILIMFASPFSADRSSSLSSRDVRPRQDHIVWYKLSDRLPNIRPAPARSRPQPPRARKQFQQTVVAGVRDNARPPQLIVAPAPEIPTLKPLPLPNLVSVAPRLVRTFTTPKPPAPAPAAAPKLPDAPEVTAARIPKDLAIAPTPVRPAGLPFHLPPVPKRLEPSPLMLPAVPEVETKGANPSMPAVLANTRRGYVAPPKRAEAPPPPLTIPDDAPPITSGSPVPDLVIAGLAPVAAPEIPTPPASRSAAFSAGPKTLPAGGSGGSSGAMLEVPGLLVEGGAKDAKPVLVAHVSPTSPEGMAAAGRMARNAGGAPPAAPSLRPAMRVSSAPDPRLEGRVVYTMAIQMPSITSHSGSWMVWFAEHQPDPGRPPQDVQPPVAIRKVDPRYVPSAMEERVEGKLRLFAVIGKDGHTASVALLSHLDDRLDRSAVEALSKWIFQPALFNGIPIEVDAVFEVPFRLAPKPTR